MGNSGSGLYSHCDNHLDCIAIKGARCDPFSSQCVCNPSAGYKHADAVCVSVRSHGEPCADPRSCDTDNNQFCDVEKLSPPRCVCEPSFVWSTSSQKCVLIAGRCLFDAQCTAESAHGVHARCDGGTRTCVCSSSTKMHRNLNRCVPPRVIGENCDEDAECETGLGEGVASCVGGNGSLNSSSSCQCKPGYAYAEPQQACLSGEERLSLGLGLALAGAVIGLLALFLLIALVVSRYRRQCNDKSKRRANKSESPPPLPLLPLPVHPHNTGPTQTRLAQVTREEFTVDYNSVLGRGKSGIVYYGTFGPTPRAPTATAIAVKTLKPDCVRVDTYMDSMYQEIEIFKSLPSHDNIIRLLGYCKGNGSRGGTSGGAVDCFVLMELCSLGSLQAFLKTNTYMEHQCAKVHSYVHRENTANASGTKSCGYYSQQDLHQFAVQIAAGIEFLQSQEIVHGDLSCRNVLLNACRVPKISDFGLARKLYDDSPVYIKTTNDFVPWKWSPSEVLTRFEYSTASDVWSFGVLLWELFSKGQEPYEGVPYRPTFAEELHGGFHRLPKPDLTSADLYRLMKKCWQSEPRARIGIVELRSRLLWLMDGNGSGEDSGRVRTSPHCRQGADGYLLQLELHDN